MDLLHHLEGPHLVGQERPCTPIPPRQEKGRPCAQETFAPSHQESTKIGAVCRGDSLLHDPFCRIPQSKGTPLPDCKEPRANGASTIQNQCFPVAVGTQLTISNCLTNPLGRKIMKCKVLTKWAQQTKLSRPSNNWPSTREILRPSFL